MECSFCIWLGRNEKAWSSKEIDLALKIPEDPFVHLNSPSSTSKTNPMRTNSPLPVSFIELREHLLCKRHPAGSECRTITLE